MTALGHTPKGPREANAAKRMHFIELWCERNNVFTIGVPREFVIGIASQAGHDGRLNPEYVRTRVARWK